MLPPRLRLPLLALVATVGLGGCVDDGYGYGLGMGYGGYYDGGYGYGAPYYGWYDDFYYPGTGYYVYDRGGRRYSWNDRQRSYWQQRRGAGGSANWQGFRQNRQQYTPEQRAQWQAQRQSSGSWSGAGGGGGWRRRGGH